MLGHQFAYSAAPIRKVKEVQFGILSPEEIVSKIHHLFLDAFLPRPSPLESLFGRQNRTPRSYG